MHHHPRSTVHPATAPATEVADLARLLLRRPELNHLDDDALLLRLARTTAVGHLLRSRVAVAVRDAERLLDAMLLDGRAVLLHVTDPAPREGVLAVRRPVAAHDLTRARDMARSLAPLIARR
ncbi:hypothetical protein CLV92_109153 [Kineococcus xinjiangensis]|uniref:Uncharacterized protein n=1 Tax=Kineococcus xinjiangensis TaxID=512762 RepID=A0A2S6II62_9ACTN|nr:hypothetical protein [Kineococcus xinjiangensis]PPK93875.1 hypothetical protein CLV92_109153 [Kineococcus xinjiangensis]